MGLDVIKILEKESNNTEQGLIHIHRDKDKWYAYEQSAFLLSEMIKGQIILSRYIIDEWLWLARAEINIEQIPFDHIICYGHDEYVLRYLPTKNFDEWVLKLEK